MKVIISALPMPPRKVTEFEPLPLQPPQVKVPEVENVTGSAFASAIPSDTTTRSNALMMVTLKTPVMVAPLLLASIRPHVPYIERTLIAWLMGTPFRVDAVTAAGQARL